MNHDFDNEFETDDELKRGRSRRKDGRKYASSGLTGRTDHCPGPYRRRLVWKAYDVPDADGYRV